MLFFSCVEKACVLLAFFFISKANEQRLFLFIVMFRSNWYWKQKNVFSFFQSRSKNQAEGKNLPVQKRMWECRIGRESFHRRMVFWWKILIFFFFNWRETFRICVFVSLFVFFVWFWFWFFLSGFLINQGGFSGGGNEESGRWKQGCQNFRQPQKYMFC